jgi:hypothetical protein
MSMLTVGPPPRGERRKSSEPSLSKLQNTREEIHYFGLFRRIPACVYFISRQTPRRKLLLCGGDRKAKIAPTISHLFVFFRSHSGFSAEITLSTILQRDGAKPYALMFIQSSVRPGEDWP